MIALQPLFAISLSAFLPAISVRQAVPHFVKRCRAVQTCHCFVFQIRLNIKSKRSSVNVMSGFAGVLLMRKRSRNRPFGCGSCLVIVLNALMLVLTSDALSAAWFPKETPGERFRKAMKTREQMCASRKLVAG